MLPQKPASQFSPPHVRCEDRYALLYLSTFAGTSIASEFRFDITSIVPLCYIKGRKGLIIEMESPITASSERYFITLSKVSVSLFDNK